MTDEGLAIETNGRVVGVAVRVRGGFMFFASDPEFKMLEANVFRSAEMIRRRVTDIVQAKQSLKEPTAIGVPPNGSAAPIAALGSNVVLFRPRPWHTHEDPEPPDAA
jgi:hypothetical protein